VQAEAQTAQQQRAGLNDVLTAAQDRLQQLQVPLSISSNSLLLMPPLQCSALHLDHSENVQILSMEMMTQV
jgi:hypothetical protein